MALRPAGRPFAAILDEFLARWDDGERPRAEDYLDGIADDDAIELIYHEFCLAESSGLEPQRVAYLERFPSHRERLARLFALRETGAALGDHSLPQTGDDIGPYHLLRELGRGSFARVFLAEQTDLEARLVVVKVSTRASPEPRLLARARHPHIVEVLRHGAIDEEAMSLIVMPFLGGATLAAVLTGKHRHRSGRRWLADLDRVSAPEYRAAGAGGATREVIAGLSHAHVAAWLVARLAEALDHAHSRGVAHGDLKPSNILLAADGRPLLLDFNLATDWHATADPDRTEPGGTLAYMAPERLLALSGAGVNSGRKPPTPGQRHRADIYALGLILAEILGVVSPEDLVPPGLDVLGLAHLRGPDGPLAARLERARPSLLRPVLRRCLAPDPAARYGRAGELAEDLDRFRQHRPFVHAAEPPWPGRLQRSLHRRSRPLAFAGLLLVAILGTSLGLHHRHNAAQREMALARLEALWSGMEPGVFRFLTFPLDEVPQRAGSPGTPLRLLTSYDLLGPNDWRTRADVRALPEEPRLELEAWLLEQAWRHASSVERRPDADPDELARALTVLGQAAGWRFPSPLAEVARRLNSRLGREGEISPGAVDPWIEAYLKGVAAETAGNLDQAAALYNDALRIRPASFWANYRASVVATRQADYAAAAGYLDRCLLRWPQHRVLPVLMAGLCVRLGDPARADELVDRAVRSGLELDQAYRTRAFARRNLGQSRDSQGALDRYASLALQEDGRSRWRYLLDAQILFGKRPSQRGDTAVDRLRVEADDDLNAHLFLACSLRDAGRHDEALAEFDKLLARSPRHLTARFIRAVLLAKLGRPEAPEAVADVFIDPRFGELLTAYVGFPGFDEAARLGRHAAASALGRGETKEALALIGRGFTLLDHLKPAPDSARLERLRAEYHFSAARVYAPDAVRNPIAGELARAELEAAATVLGTEMWVWYFNDPAFKSLIAPVEPMDPVRDPY